MNPIWIFVALALVSLIAAITAGVYFGSWLIGLVTAFGLAILNAVITLKIDHDMDEHTRDMYSWPPRSDD